MKKLPIGIQTFSQIQEEGYIYVDKTKEAFELINDFKYSFLSRPRRFGKSLFIDTLKNIFEAKKELFKGLYIYDKWDWTKSYPVIKISWDGKNRTIQDLELNLKSIIQENQNRLGIDCEAPIEHPICLRELIIKAYQKYNQKVVVLIDEYDKPILDVIEDKDQAKEHREYIKGLYSILKGVDEYIQFAFLTGVSKFSKASIFSGLNNLSDISLNPKYGNICGYTQADIETIFSPYLENIDLDRVKEWYNGYNFLKDSVYNPFDILQFIKNDCTFDNYWFESGTPTYLIKLIKERDYYLPRLSNLIIDKRILNSFDVENIDIEVLLYQSGYLTIEKAFIDDFGIEYKLKLPNREVKISLNDYIIEYLYGQKEFSTKKRELYRALTQANLNQIKEILISLFASLANSNYTKNDIANYEGFYASVIYAYFASLAIDIIAEDITNRGRIDLTLFVENIIYILEFKVGSGNAIEQIKAKNYPQKYLNQGKDIYIVGIVFDAEDRNIAKFEWEKVES